MNRGFVERNILPRPIKLEVGTFDAFWLHEHRCPRWENFIWIWSFIKNAKIHYFLPYLSQFLEHWAHAFQLGAPSVDCKIKLLVWKSLLHCRLLCGGIPFHKTHITEHNRHSTLYGNQLLVSKLTFRNLCAIHSILCSPKMILTISKQISWDFSVYKLKFVGGLSDVLKLLSKQDEQSSILSVLLAPRVIIVVHLSWEMLRFGQLLKW